MNKTMEMKDYQKPTVEVIELIENVSLLSGSGFDPDITDRSATDDDPTDLPD